MFFQSRKSAALERAIFRTVMSVRPWFKVSRFPQSRVFWKLTHSTLLLILALQPPFSVAAESENRVESPTIIVVVGASGTPQFEISFYQWSERWVAAAKQAGLDVTVIGRHRGEEKIVVSDYDLLKQAIGKANHDSKSELWIVLIGHGTFDRRVARFNLRGPDVSAEELNEWLTPARRPTAVINCASASGAFIPILSNPNRIVVTATKSGTEVNFSRFGDYLSQAIADPAADLDKDHQTSLWEAFLMASRRTAEYYDTEGRVATEHALLEDDGDGNGVRADQFRGIAIAKSKEGPSLDGRRSHQWHLVPNAADAALSPEIRVRRNQLELAIEQWRERKDELPSNMYLNQLERYLIELAELNEQSDRSSP